MSSQESFESDNQFQYQLRSKRKKTPISRKTQKKQRTNLRTDLRKQTHDSHSSKNIELQSSDSDMPYEKGDKSEKLDKIEKNEKIEKIEKSEKNGQQNEKQQEENYQMQKDYSNLPTFLYRPLYYTFPDLREFVDQLIRVIIEKNDFPTKNNYYAFYGNEFYSSDSDIASIVQHSGTFNFWASDGEENSQLNKSQFPENAYGLEVILKVAKPRNLYNSVEKNWTKSQKKQDYNGRALKVIWAQPLLKLDKEIEIKKMAEKCPNMYERKRDKNKEYPSQSSILPGMFLCYNLSNHPAIVYQVAAISDFVCEDKSQWWSQKLKEKTLYFDSNRYRYELSYVDKKYRWAQVKYIDGLDFWQQPINDIMLCNTPYPLENLLNVIEDLEWKEIKWRQQSVRVRNQVFDIRCFRWEQNKTMNQKESSSQNWTWASGSSQNSDTESKQSQEEKAQQDTKQEVSDSENGSEG